MSSPPSTGRLKRISHGASRRSLIRAREQGRLSATQFSKTMEEKDLQNMQLDAFECSISPNTAVATTSLSIEKDDGRFLLGGCVDGSLSVVDLDNLVFTRSLHRPELIYKVPRAHGSAVSFCSWYGWEKQMYVSSGFDGKVHVWDAEHAERVHTFPIRERVYSFAMSPLAVPSHSLIAVASADGGVRLCDLESGSCAHTLFGHRGGTAQASEDRAMEFHRRRTGLHGSLSSTSDPTLPFAMRKRYIHQGGVWCSAFFPGDDRYLATGDSDGVIHIWDIRRVDCFLASLDQFQTVNDADAFQSHQLHSLYNSRPRTSSARSTTDSLSSTVQVRSLSARRAGAGATAHDDGVVNLQFSDDGLYLFSLDRAGFARLWDCGRGLANTKVHFERRARPWARGSSNDAVRQSQWNASAPRSFVQATVLRGSNAVAIPSGPSVLLSSLPSGRALPTLSGHFHDVRCVTSHPHKTEVYAGAQNGMVLRWTGWKQLPPQKASLNSAIVDDVDSWSTDSD